MKKGISLIVLVITIIVIIILAGAIILSLSANNPIESANKATCLSDIANFRSAVALDYASNVSIYMNTDSYSQSSSITVIQGKLSEKYGISSTVDSKGVITFTAATNLPAGVELKDGDISIKVD